MQPDRHLSFKWPAKHTDVSARVKAYLNASLDGTNCVVHRHLPLLQQSSVAAAAVAQFPVGVKYTGNFS